jgi:hypothetical protein
MMKNYKFNELAGMNEKDLLFIKAEAAQKLYLMREERFKRERQVIMTIIGNIMFYQDQIEIEEKTDA